MSDWLQQLARREFDAGRLMTEHPPVFVDKNKRIVFEIASPPGTEYRGRVAYTRWQAAADPLNHLAMSRATRVTARPGFYDYTRATADGTEWHVNFADPYLFVAYSASLFAQDEMQVAEHPLLGALREALVAQGLIPMTVEDQRPTPILITGVPRNCRIATDPNESEGRPEGLYGNRFRTATPAAVRNATTRIVPPTITNLIAMAAPSGGYGAYQAPEIGHILVTACTAFRAAVLESNRGQEQRKSVVVHTGFWGCGAFGGNRVLMTALQILAAHFSDIDLLAFHTGDPAGTKDFKTAQQLVEQFLAKEDVQVGKLIGQIEAQGFEWGVSDGN